MVAAEAGYLLLDVATIGGDVLSNLAGVVLEHAADSVACLLLMEVLAGREGERRRGRDAEI